MAINSEIYLQNCIKKQLSPFIKEYYSDNKYVFWPDLATSHYANIVQNYLKSENNNFVAKRDNPANVPKARPIEDFWACLKQKVYKGNWCAKNIEELKKRIQSCLRDMDPKFVQDLAYQVNKRLDKIRRYGVKQYFVFCFFNNLDLIELNLNTICFFPIKL